MPPKNKFQDGEAILCFHGPLLYEAKCVRAEVKDKLTRYFIHYSGWNKSWDEWVPESRLLKYNEQGLQKQKELKLAHQASKKKAKKEREKEKEKEKEERTATPSGERQEKSKAKAGRETPVHEQEVASPASEPRFARRGTKAQEKESTSEPPAKKKRATRGDTAVEPEETFVSKLEVKIKLPEDLKPWLVDDWDLIARQKQLVNIPCKKSVDDILDEYVKHKMSKDKHVNRDALLEVSQGIREYFNVMLGSQLLYKFERPQYSEVLADHPDTPMSKLYGATHLLRLFVKLGSMLAFTTLEEKSMQLLLTHIQDFLKYIHKNSTSLFNLGDYIVAPPEYQRKAIT